MKRIIAHLVSTMLLFVASTTLFAEERNLQYYLAKASSKETALTREEKADLLDQIETVLEKAQRIRGKLTQSIQSGELDIRYQEGRFWLSKLEDDSGSIDTAAQQIRLLRNKPALLAPSTRLYKSLKDLSSNFNACNNLPSFSGVVGDLAPEIELWADPVFYELYLLPLARLKDHEMESKGPKEKTVPAQKEKSPPSRGKKP